MGACLQATSGYLASDTPNNSWCTGLNQAIEEDSSHSYGSR